MNILFLTSAAPKKGPIPFTEKRPPLGLGFLMSVLKNQGHNIHFSDQYLQPSNILESNFLKENKIDFVGIYSNTLCYQSTLNMFKILQNKRMQRKWNGKIIVGGPHTAFGYKEIPSFVDHILIGEGEITVPKIINGLVKERIVTGEKVKDLDSLPMPAWEEFIHLPYMWHDYRMKGTPIYTFNTSRGCPYNCTFCSVKGVWGKNYRYMSARRVVHDIEHMIKYYGLKGAFFREDHFTLNKKRNVEFSELLLKKNIKIDWMCESRVDCIDDPEIIKLMARSGCKALYIGVESGSPKMLKWFEKGETIEQFIRVFEYLKKYKIHSHASFVMHAPKETDKDRDLTEKLIKKIKPGTVRKNVYIGLPGSKLCDYAKKHNLIEYIDKNGVNYLKGFHKNIKKYYGNDEFYEVYDPLTFKEERSFEYFKQLSKLDKVLKINKDIDEKLIEKRLKQNKKEIILKQYLESVIRKVWDNSKLNGKYIALYGAGTHTKLVLDILKEIKFNNPYVIFDKNPKKAIIKKFKVDLVKNVSKYKINKILISNDVSHYEIYYELLKNKKLKNIEIIDPYLYLPNTPYR